MELVKNFIIILVLLLEVFLKNSNQQVKFGTDLRFKAKVESSTKENKTKMIEVFKDKDMAQKVLSFDMVSFDDHKAKDNTLDGLIFDTSNSNNAGVAENFFEDVTIKESDKKFILKYTSIIKCEVAAISKPNMNYQIIQLPVLNEKGEESFIALDFPLEAKVNAKKIADKISKNCKQFKDILTKKFNEFWKEVQGYWNVKGQVEKVANKIKETTTQQTNENDKHDQVKIDKKDLQKSLQEAEENLKKINVDMDKVQKNLKDEYKAVDKTNEEKSVNQKYLTDLNADHSKLNSESKDIQKEIERQNKQTGDYRKKLQTLIKELSDIKTQMNDQEKSITTLKEKDTESQDEIEKLNKEINENNTNIAEHNKEIQKNKGLINKMNLEGVPNTIGKTKNLISENDKVAQKSMEAFASTVKEISKLEEKRKKAKEEKKSILSDEGIIKAAKEAKIQNNLQNTREYYDKFHKTFPFIPTIFYNNLWNFMRLNHYEAMNYLQAIKPSPYGIYDNIFANNDPVRIKNKQIVQNKKKT